MKIGDIAAHGRYTNRIGFVTAVNHASHGPISSYEVEWLNGSQQGKRDTISAWNVVDMQEALESARAEVNRRESDLIKWCHAAAIAKIAVK
jgi:3-oxoacyl-(acyl-carrier-protein) synthase